MNTLDGGLALIIIAVFLAGYITGLWAERADDRKVQQYHRDRRAVERRAQRDARVIVRHSRSHW